MPARIEAWLKRPVVRTSLPKETGFCTFSRTRNASFGPTSAITMRMAEDPTSITAIGSAMELIPGAFGGAHDRRVILQFGRDDLDVPRGGTDGAPPHRMLSFPQDDPTHRF